MLSPINLRGYGGDDPLDRLPPVYRYLLAMVVTAVVSMLLVILITRVFRLVQFAGLWVDYVEVASFTLLVAPFVVTFRKSTALLHYAFVLLPLFAIDLYLESHVRVPGVRALWDYTPGTFIGQIQPVPFRFLVTLSVHAVLVGPVCLWLSRLLAQRLRGQAAGRKWRPRWTNCRSPSRGRKGRWTARGAMPGSGSSDSSGWRTSATWHSYSWEGSGPRPGPGRCGCCSR